MIRSKHFTSTIFDMFSLTHKDNEVWPVGPDISYSQSQVVFHAKDLGL